MKMTPATQPSLVDSITAPDVETRFTARRVLVTPVFVDILKRGVPHTDPAGLIWTLVTDDQGNDIIRCHGMAWRVRYELGMKRQSLFSKHPDSWLAEWPD